MRIKQLFTITFMVISCLSFSACSSTSDQAMDGVVYHDPFENANRRVYAFNNAVNDAYMTPVVEGYRALAPAPARSRVTNFLRYLKTPVTLANQLLQGDLEGSKNVVLRATINTFVGGFGLFDVAGFEGYEYEPEDFGQTLAVWGVGHGPYLVTPLLGGSSVRDVTGYVVDGVADPLNLYLSNVEKGGALYGRLGVGYLDLRDSLYDVLADLESNSIDPYASVRSAYYQRRAALVQDIGARGSLSSASDFDDIY